MSNLNLRNQVLDPSKRNTLYYFIAHHDPVDQTVRAYLPVHIVNGSLIIGDRNTASDYTLPASRAASGAEYALTSSAVLGGQVNWATGNSSLPYKVIRAPEFSPPIYNISNTDVALEVHSPPFTSVVLPTAISVGYGKIYVFRKVGGGGLTIARATGSSDTFDSEITDIKLYHDVYVKMISNGVDGWFLL